MLKVSLVNPYKSWNKIKPLKLEGGFNNFELSMDINGAYELKTVLNTSSEIYDELRNNFDYGLIIETQDVTLGFIKARDPQFDGVKGVATITFYSSVWKLKYSEPLQQNQTYNGSAINFINSIDSEFVWLPISKDKNIVFSSGVASNFDMLKSVLDLSNWIYRDNGMIFDGVNYKPSIVYGDPRDFDNYFGTIKANNTTSLDNPFDTDFILITDLKLNYSGEVFTHLRVFGDVGQGGASNNSAVSLSNPFASYINPEFPLVQINNKYYIQNTKIASQRYWNTYTTQVFTLTSNTYNPTANQVLDVNNPTETNQLLSTSDAESYIYNKGVQFLKEHQEATNYTFSFAFKKILLPMQKISISYKETQETFSGIKTIYDIQTSQILRNLRYDNLTIFL